MESDTNNWNKSLNVRLITADEIAQIVDADKENTLKWNSNKNYGVNPESEISWFYLDGKKNSNNLTYSNEYGWQKQVADNSDKSDYAWLYDNTMDCNDYGCNISSSSTYGYWTSTKVTGLSISAWHIYREGELSHGNITDPFGYGIRPVISI